MSIMIDVPSGSIIQLNLSKQSFGMTGFCESRNVCLCAKENIEERKETEQFLKNVFYSYVQSVQHKQKAKTQKNASSHKMKSVNFYVIFSFLFCFSSSTHYFAIILIFFVDILSALWDFFGFFLRFQIFFLNRTILKGSR